MRDTKTTGQLGETLVQKYLVRRGFRIERTNYNTTEGEIDIIARQNMQWRFVEVKTRKQFFSDKGEPSESIHRLKRIRLEKAMYRFLEEHPEITEYHLDVALVLLHEGKARIIYYPNALEAYHDI